jgi:hypothetical protein
MNCSGKGTKMAKVAEKPTSGKRMTQQQQDFLNNFMHKDMTQTAAAREAGYANPNVDAVRILNRPIIQERIQEMRVLTWWRLARLNCFHRIGHLARSPNQ